MARVEIVAKAVEWFAAYLTPAGIEDHRNRGYYEFSRYWDGSVFDIELWDIEGKRLGQPIWRLTGAAAPRPMRVYYSHWSQDPNPRTPERLAELAAKTRGLWNSSGNFLDDQGGDGRCRQVRLLAGSFFLDSRIGSPHSAVPQHKLHCYGVKRLPSQTSRSPPAGNPPST